MATFDDPTTKTRRVQVVDIGWQPASGQYWTQIFVAPDDGTGAPDTANEVLAATYGPTRTQHRHFTGGQALSVPWWHFRARHIHPTDSGITPGSYTGYVRAIGYPIYLDPVVMYAAPYGSQSAVTSSTQFLSTGAILGPHFAADIERTDSEAQDASVAVVSMQQKKSPGAGVQAASRGNFITSSTAIAQGGYSFLARQYVASTYGAQLMGGFGAFGPTFPSTGAVVTNSYRYTVFDGSTLGTVTNNYGFYANNLTAGTMNAALALGLGRAIIGGVVTPAQTTASANTYYVGDAVWVRASASSAIGIGGIVSSDSGTSGLQSGRMLTLTNIGSNAITLHNDTSGTDVTQQILTGTSADITLNAHGSAHMWYDGVTQRWRVMNWM